MNNGHLNSSLGINTHFNSSSVSSGGGGGGDGGSPLNSPLISPVHAGSVQDNGSWDQLQTQFTQHMSLQPPSPIAPMPTKSGSGNTFVHKLYK